MTRRPIFALIPAAIALVAVLNVALPYYLVAPGPAKDVKPLIELKGVRTYPASGKLMLTTVSLRDTRVADAVAAWLDAELDVIPRAAYVPPGTSEDEVDKQNVEQMTESKRAAAAAAASLLGYQLKITGAGARVESVLDGSPASKVLQRDDVITVVDGRAIRDATELVTQVRKHKVGDEVLLRVTRAGAEHELRVRTVRSADDPDVPMVGVQITTESGNVELPFGIDIRSDGIGGPSAGLMFALGIVDLLEEGDLTKGVSVAGTGVISTSGEVGAVGGVTQKVAAAKASGALVFIVPADEVREARRAANGLAVVGVRNLTEAVDALKRLRPTVQAARKPRR